MATRLDTLQTYSILTLASIPLDAGLGLGKLGFRSADLVDTVSGLVVELLKLGMYILPT